MMGMAKVSVGTRFRRVPMYLFCLLALCAAPLHGQATGTLTLEVTVQSSISLVFESAPGGCVLDNSGTNNVGLYLGYAVFTGGGSYTGCGTMAKLSGGRYQVSTPFQVVVNKSNSSSPSYRLSSWLAALPPTDVSWVLNPDGNGNGTVLSTTQQYYETANAYGRRTEVLAVQVKNPVPQQMLGATINFMATAN